MHEFADTTGLKPAGRNTLTFFIRALRKFPLLFLLRLRPVT